MFFFDGRRVRRKQGHFLRLLRDDVGTEDNDPTHCERCGAALDENWVQAPIQQDLEVVAGICTRCDRQLSRQEERDGRKRRKKSKRERERKRQSQRATPEPPFDPPVFMDSCQTLSDEEQSRLIEGLTLTNKLMMIEFLKQLRNSGLQAS